MVALRDLICTTGIVGLRTSSLCRSSPAQTFPTLITTSTLRLAYCTGTRIRTLTNNKYGLPLEFCLASFHRQHDLPFCSDKPATVAYPCLVFGRLNGIPSAWKAKNSADAEPHILSFRAQK